MSDRQSIIEAALTLPGAEIETVRPHFREDGSWDWECVSVFSCPSDARFLLVPLRDDDPGFPEQGDTE